MPSNLVVNLIEEVQMIFHSCLPRFNDPIIPIPRVCTISEIPLVKPSEIIASLGEPSSQIGASPTILPIAMNKIYYALSGHSLFGGIQVILEGDILIIMCLHTF